MAETMGWLRAAVGVALLLAAGPFLRLGRRDDATPVALMLLRTIGIRDLAIGLGTVAAARHEGGDLGRWARIGLLSDSLDVGLSLASWQGLGGAEAAGAGTAAAAFALGDAVALARLRRLVAGARSGP